MQAPKMVKCEKCKVLKNEVSFLRKRIREMTDRLMALADARAYEAVRFDRGNDSNDYYGSSSDDDYVGHDIYGQKILLKKDIEVT